LPGAASDAEPPAAFSDFQPSFDVTLLADIAYRKVGNDVLKLDIYAPRDGRGKSATVIHFHGGGWIKGTRQEYVQRLAPYIEKGWIAVNVDYRLASTAQAPAAVEDCRCALRWVLEHAEEYGIDRNRVVVTGGSAGGHLALMAGMLPGASGFDRCPPFDDSAQTTPPAGPEPPVAAIVNWFGATDVAELLAGPYRRTFAVTWIGDGPGAEDLARRLSPLSYVQPGVPPVATVHGDADPTVPYSHATRLNEAMKRAGADHRLHTVRGGRHGNFTPAQYDEAWAQVFGFLGGLGLRGAGRSDWRDRP
jgi:acetyl esterase/lipase